VCLCVRVFAVLDIELRVLSLSHAPNPDCLVLGRFLPPEAV
jgi:hypothetical protein